MTPLRHTPLFSFFVGMLGIASFSMMDAVMKGLVIALGIYATMVWRMLAGVIFAGALFATRPNWPARHVMRIHLIRGALTTVMALLFFWGLAKVPLAQAIALAFIAPLIALFLAAAILGETISRQAIGASLIAFAGVLLIFIGQAQADLGREALLGSLAILASAICYAVNIILMRQQAQVAKPIEIAFFQNVIVAVLLLAAWPAVGGADVPPADQIPFILLASFLSTTSLLLLSWAYARAEASYLAATEYTSFLWAMLLGWLIFGESVSLYTLAGAGLIVAGCFIAARRPEDVTPALEAAA
ncbi:MAG: DMT family transporter [Pseudomonadota bacterium]|nr:DMT family transporter [Pseudomonadota bacterium]